MFDIKSLVASFPRTITRPVCKAIALITMSVGMLATSIGFLHVAFLVGLHVPVAIPIIGIIVGSFYLACGLSLCKQYYDNRHWKEYYPINSRSTPNSINDYCFTEVDVSPIEPRIDETCWSRLRQQLNF